MASSAEQLDDRLGDIRDVGRRPPLVGDDAERLAGGGRARRHRGSGSGSRCPGAPEQPGRPDDPERPPRDVREGRPWPAARRPAFEAPYGLAGRARIVRADTRGRRSAARRRPRWSRWPAGRCRARRRPSPASRSPARCGDARGPGSSAQPSTSVQAAAWTTTSGRSRSRRDPIGSGASRSNAARSQAIGPAGPVNGASARAATSARPRRPARRSPATRISRAGVGGLGDAAAPGTVPAAAVLALVPAVPIAACGPPATRLRWRRNQSTVEARPSSNVVVGRQPSAASFAAVHRVAAVVARPILHLPDQRPGLVERSSSRVTTSRLVRSTPPATL